MTFARRAALFWATTVWVWTAWAQRPGRTLMGEWEEPLVNMLLAFYPDSSFLMQTIFSDIKGQFKVEKKQLVFQSGQQRLQYRIRKLNARKLVLEDPEGKVLAFLRKDWIPPDSAILAEVAEYKLSTQELRDFERYVEAMTLVPLTEASRNNLRVLLMGSFHKEPEFTVNYLRRAIAGYEKVRAAHDPIIFARRRNDLLVDLYYYRLYDQLTIAIRLVRLIKRYHPIEFFDEDADLVFFQRVFNDQSRLFRSYLMILGLSPYQYDRFQPQWARHLRRVYRNESVEFREFLATVDLHVRLLLPSMKSVEGRPWRRFKKDFRKQSFSSYLKGSRLRFLKNGDMFHWQHAFAELGRADLHVWYKVLETYTGRKIDPWLILPIKYHLEEEE